MKETINITMNLHIRSLHPLTYFSDVVFGWCPTGKESRLGAQLA